MNKHTGAQIIGDSPLTKLKRDIDTGCELHKSCLNCPEEVCIYDLFDINQETRTRQRRELKCQDLTELDLEDKAQEQVEGQVPVHPQKTRLQVSPQVEVLEEVV